MTDPAELAKRLRVIAGALAGDNLTKSAGQIREAAAMLDQLASTMSAEEVREAALSLIESERLTDETGEPDDVAHNRAINDCLEAIRAMPLTKNGEA